MTKIDLSYPKILDLFREHLDPKRTESASFLIWYLENYLRLDPAEAVDSVCDQNGDKGVDGIYVNDDAHVIEVYQSKISQKLKSSIGDTALKEFDGTLNQFKSATSIKELAKSAGKADVGQLILRLELQTKIQTYGVRGVFISNIDLDKNGESYLKSHSQIRFIGGTELTDSFISSSRTALVSRPAKFDVSGFDVATYVVDKDHSAVTAPIKATELIKLDGITSQALFAYNVRGPLGRTQVNKDIAESIQDPQRHKLFPLFHNGITIIAETIEVKSDSIQISNYYVVNGCQSLSELFNNAKYLTGELRVSVKFLKMKSSSKLSEMVTSFSNNQNGVKARDFKSNNPIQVRLQNEFASTYGKEWFYEVKRGEDSKGIPWITNEEAGLYLMAFDLKRPWGTHRKYQIFDDDYANIFGRPGVTSHRIVLCHLITGRINGAIGKLKNSLFAKYVLTRFLLLYILRLILEEDDLGKEALEKPEAFTTDKARREAFLDCIDNLLKDIVIDLNAEVDQLGDTFDYRGKLRDEAWVKSLAGRIVADYRKIVSRGRIEDIKSEFTANLKARAGKDGRRRSKIQVTATKSTTARKQNVRIRLRE